MRIAHNYSLRVVLVGFFYLIFFNSCSTRSHQSEPRRESKFNNKIVLIFDHAPENSRYKFPSGITNNSGFEIKYIDDNFLPHRISPDSSKIDTVVINTSCLVFELQHCYKGADHLSYFFKNGDSVLFSYNDKKPKVSIINRITKKYDVNYEIRLRELIFLNDFPARIKSKFPFAFHKFESKNDFATSYAKVEDKFKLAAFEQVNEERKFLDGILKDDSISTSVARLFKIKNEYDSISLIFSQTNSPVSFKHSFSDSLLHFDFYHDFLDNVIYQYYSSKVNKIKNGSATIPDFKAIYGTIKSNDSISDLSKRILLRKTLEEIIQGYPLEVVKAYSKDFEKIDPVSFSYLCEKFRLNYDNSSDLKLVSYTGITTTLDSLISRNKGKLIYVDFWASWCGPCIQQFPYSRELKNDFEGKGISFIYLSTDTDSTKWRRVSKKFMLENSFLINNRYSSKLIRELNLSAIPRYVLYDKKGNLIHKNAPRPQGEEVRKLINEYLLKN